MRVGLFATCLVDFMRPSVGFAAANLLERAGCAVDVPLAQTCCGQPAWNNGDRRGTRRLARRTIRLLERYDHVVIPSGSCAAMIRVHYPEVFAGDRRWQPRAEALAAKTWELTAFLSDVMGRNAVLVRHRGSCTYHDSCSGLRELGVREQPRRLLSSIFGLELRELPESEVCCGFGGTFCVKYPEISNRMVEDKTGHVRATGADMLLAGDLGCLLNMAGKLRREGSEVEVRHVAEVLAGMLDEPGIGDPDPRASSRVAPGPDPAEQESAANTETSAER